MVSQELLNGNKELEERRKLEGVSYKPPRKDEKQTILDRQRKIDSTLHSLELWRLMSEDPQERESLSENIQALQAERAELDNELKRIRREKRTWFHEWLIEDEKQQAAKKTTDPQPKPLPDLPTTITTTPQAAEKPPKKQPTISWKVKVYPTLALAYIQQKLAPVAAIYHLLKAYDHEGRGVVSRDIAREIFTVKKPANAFHWRLITWRRLRQIFDQGEGIFWTIAGDNIHLYGPDKVSNNLGAGRLRGRPVLVPTGKLAASSKKVKAYFYATFDAGMSRNNPMTRQSRRRATGVPERTQLEYDKEAGTKRLTNIAVTPFAYNRENIQRFAWERGKNVFKYFDAKGKYAKKRRSVIAWRMPNSYISSLETAPKGRQKKHNRKIDLVENLERGNDLEFVRIYHPTAQQAGREFNRRPDINHFYDLGGGFTLDAARKPKFKGARYWWVLATE